MAQLVRGRRREVEIGRERVLLFQELRWQLRQSKLARAQVGRLRTTLLKVSARVTESVRRIAFHLPTSYAFDKLWRCAARALGATQPSALAG